jgi:chemotaxis protein MotB
MARKKKPEEPEKPQNHERWLLTYSDMITLLMVFFVVLYAMSNVSQAKFEALAESLSIVFDGLPGIQLQEGGGGHSVVVTSGPPKTTPGTGLAPKVSPKRSIFMEKATTTLASELRTQAIQMNTEARGIVLSLTGDTFFRPGEAVLKEGTLPSLVKVGELLQSVQDREIVVEGHSDNSPMSPGGPWPSNLMLSAARSVNVVEALDLIGVSKARMSATGFGDSKPARTNDTPEGRAYNRRVDVLILFPTE